MVSDLIGNGRVSRPYVGFAGQSTVEALPVRAAVADCFEQLAAYALGAGVDVELLRVLFNRAVARGQLVAAGVTAGEDAADLLERERHGSVEDAERERYGGQP